MSFKIFCGIMIPFVGTLLGVSCVILVKSCLEERLRVALLGLAAGIMTAASVWSLIIPAIEYSSDMGRLAFIPATVGFLFGAAFLLILEWAIPKIRVKISGEGKKISGTTMLVLAVGLHNIPEGMAVGAVFAGLLAGNTGITLGGAFALSMGIAIQNIPEGAIVSMPLKAEGKSQSTAVLAGILSGAVEPLGALVTLYSVGYLMPILPYLLGFAAGAMIYVVVSDLIPEALSEGNDTVGLVAYALGFSIMMILDVALG